MFIRNARADRGRGPSPVMALAGVVCLVVSLVVTTADASAQSSDTDTVWGHVESISTNANSGADPDMTFVVREASGGDGLPFGTFVYQTENGSKYVGKVDCFVRIDENTVAVGGDILSTNVETWTEFGWTAWIHDGPTSAEDWIRPTVGPAAECDLHPWTSAGVPLSERWAVERGQIRMR